VAIDPQGRWLVGGSDHGVIELWEFNTGKILRMLEGHELSVYSLAFDPRGHKLASGGNDKTIRLWDVSRSKLLRTFRGHEGTVRGVAFDPTGQTLAGASSDKTVQLWDVTSGTVLHTLTGHTSRVESVAYSSDGRLLASKCRAGTIRLWNCETWKTVAIIPEPTYSEWWVSALAFHPSLPLLAVAGSEPDAPEPLRSRRVHIWELDVDLLLHGDRQAPTEYGLHTKTAMPDDTGVGNPNVNPAGHQPSNLSNELGVKTECLG
jgi:WD40 repeat protein